MATRYYGAAIGGMEPADVSEAGSTTSLPVEIAIVYDATGMTKMLALQAIEAIRNAIIKDAWPPA
jgi:hypothetical protein